MSSFELVVRLHDYQHLLNITTCETVPEIKIKIESICNVDLTNGEHVLEVYDTTLDDYIVLTERYLMEFKKRLSTTTTQRLQARLEPFQWEEGLTPALTEYRSYVVVWLDEHIGRVQEYVSFKHRFCSMLDVNGASPSVSDQWCDIENLIRFERIPIYTTIYFFEQSDACLRFIKENSASTAIFLITSTHFGRIIAPIVANQVYAIYVFCFFIEINMVWASNYTEFIQMFDFDSDLLIRLIRDIAEYCMERGKERMVNNDQKQALKYWSDAKILLHRTNKIGTRYFDENLDYIDYLLDMLPDNEAESSECEEA